MFDKLMRGKGERRGAFKTECRRRTARAAPPPPPDSAGRRSPPGARPKLEAAPPSSAKLSRSPPPPREFSKLQFAAEALQHDLGRVSLGAGLVLLFARLQLALDIDFRALLAILLDDAADIVVEDHDIVPLGLLLALAGVLVAPGLGSGEREVDHLVAGIERRTLGSLPRLPTRMTLLTLPAMMLSSPPPIEGRAVLTLSRLTRMRRRTERPKVVRLRSRLSTCRRAGGLEAAAAALH